MMFYTLDVIGIILFVLFYFILFFHFICSSILCCKVDVWVYPVHVLQETLLLCSIYDHKSVIHIPLPNTWRAFSCIDGLVLKILHIEVGPHIHFTTEDAGTDGSIPFLGTIVMPQPEDSPLTSVYRKPTHTDQYLQWKSPPSVSQI